MSYEKQNFVDGQTLTAAQLNHMEAGIAEAGGVKGDKGDKGEKGDTGSQGSKGDKGDPGEGFTANAKALLLNLFENAAYKTSDAQDTLNALRVEWGGSAQDIPVQSVSLSSSALTLNEGESKTLTATVLPANATSRVVVWRVAPAGFATVANGVVTGIKAGSCTVTATAGGKSASCTVTVAATVAEDVPGETPVYKLAAPKTFVPANKEYIDTGIKMFESIDPKPEYTILFEAQYGENVTAKGDTWVLMHCMEEATPWPGFVVHVVGDGSLQANYYASKNTFRAMADMKASKYRFALVFEGTNVKRWMDNGLYDTTNITGYNTAVNKSLLLGCYQQSDGTKGRFFDGTLYQCLVYNKALTDDQVRAWITA